MQNGRKVLPVAERIRLMQLFYTFDIETGGGGLSRFAIEFGKKLDWDRFEVIFCSLGKFDEIPSSQDRIAKLNADGFEAFAAIRWENGNAYFNFLKAHKALSEYLSRNPIDILHSHNEFTDVNALLLKIQNKAPRILRTVHYGYQHEWMKRPLRRLLLTNFLYPIYFDIEIGINQQNTDRLNRRGMARLFKRRARRIYNAIPVEKFGQIQVNAGELKGALGIPPNAPVIGTIGRLAEQKGYTYLIQAAPIILEAFPEARFLIIGDGPLADELKDQARRSAAGSKIIFTGSRPDIEALLNCMDLFVSPSLWEGLPTVILESMICKVPVVATDIPGTTELIKAGHNGWLVPPADPLGMAQAVIAALRDPSARDRYADNARQTVDKFSMGSIAVEYERLYDELLGK
jgi:glycosyltransferase involved in cell wall biosynthesis